MGKGNRKKLAKAAEASAAHEAAQLTYWHGGTVGRAIGDQLIPGAEVAELGADYYENMPQEWAKDYRPDFAYITTDRELAHDFAVRHAWRGFGAAIYEVKPVGKLMHDPDYPRGTSFRCMAAEVVAVGADEFTASSRECGAAHRYMTWDDGAPLYDQDGYALPNKTGMHFGVTPADLKGLGRRVEFGVIERRSSMLIMQRNPGITQDDVTLVRRSTGGKIK